MNRAASTGKAATTQGGTMPLERGVPVGTLQEVQDCFAALGRMTVVVCSVEGVPITTPTWGSRFSAMIGTSARGSEEFASALQHRAARVNERATQTCLDGMVVYAAPIEHDGARLAVITVGTRTHAPPDRDAAHALAAKYGVDGAELSVEALRINPLRGGAVEDIHRFADVLAQLIATLYGRAWRSERQRADLHAIHKLSDLLAGTLNLQEILDLTVRQVVAAMPIKACAIRLLNEETGELVLKAVYNLSEEYLRKGPVTLRENAIDATAFAGETVYIEDAPNDPRSRYPENARREGIVSGLCVPMTYRGETIGVIRVYTGRRYRFSESEEALVRSIGSQAAAAIINSRLFDQSTKAEFVRRQMKAAGQIQRRMLPASPPRQGHATFGCVYDPTLDLGGDLYDFIELPAGRMGVCIADVVGKGLPAALLMASNRAALRAFAHSTRAVASAVEKVNRHMFRETLVSEFTTMVYGVFSPDGRAFDYCNAGHPPPMIFRGDEIIELAAGGMAIGIDPHFAFESEQVTLQVGDVVVMITDGVTDAMNFEGTPYGRARLLDSVRRHRGLQSPALAAQLLWDVRRFVGLAHQSDDITILVARVD